MNQNLNHHDRAAPGHPGIEPRWSRSDKDGVGTAYSASSPLWFTTSAGIVNEVYFPTIDSPQIRDLQFMVADGASFFCDERRGTQTSIRRLCHASLGYVVVNQDHDGRFQIEKTIIAAPHAPCLLVRTQWKPAKGFEKQLKLYALLAPHLGIGGWKNSGFVELTSGRTILVAEGNGIWLAMDCSSGFSRASCGFVGASDGWRDLSEHFELRWQYDSAKDGNIALTGEVALEQASEFTLALAFGEHRHAAITSLSESLAIPFEDQLERFQTQWQRACSNRDNSLSESSTDSGELVRMSHNVLLAHEDKTYHGAMIASLSIPWGEVKSDDDIGGYHLVWTRDMVNSATGLMAAGETATPLRALIYLAASQKTDGGFYQNFWIDGHPYWQGTQLDEVAFPIILAWRLKKAGALLQFDPYPMVKAAAGYLVRQGPATPQERWEENSGYSPSTLAAHISGLVCASQFASERGDLPLASYFAEYADFLQQHVERWTVTDCGTILPEVPRHFIRVLPMDLSNPTCSEDPNSAQITIRNRARDLKNVFPARSIVDAGFLELVRYGIYSPDDSLIVDSLKVVDSELKIDTPHGPCWRRYTYDGYGQRADGGPFTGVGQGRAWPLLTGERAHYELAAGNPIEAYIAAIEHFAGATGLLPEQIWDEPDRPDTRMKFGCPTGSAMPLMWAHAEYIKLLRSVRDGCVFDLITEVANRYRVGNANRHRSSRCQDQQVFPKAGGESPQSLATSPHKGIEIWKFNRQPTSIRQGDILRIQAGAEFRLRWSRDAWETFDDSHSTTPGQGIHFVDLPTSLISERIVHFTFWWIQSERWEGLNYTVHA